MDQQRKVVVLGAGVLGLSIAKELAERGVHVSVVARDLPLDLDSTGFASPWAGANWSSYSPTGGTQEARWDTITFHHYAELSKNRPDVVSRTQFKRIWNNPEGYDPPWFKDLVFGFRPLRRDELVPGFAFGETFESYTMNPPAYLSYLSSELDRLGVRMVRARLSALDEAYNLPAAGSVDLVVNATGLGSRGLIGVEDQSVYPIRGDTVLVRAPGIRTVYKIRDIGQEDQKAGKRFYIIPRPGPEGQVILGGTEMEDDWDTLPRPKTIERILKEAYEVCPALSRGRGWEGIEVISCNVGLRPARRGGARVELEHRVLGQRRGVLPASARSDAGRRVAVVHAYGIGPAGYQTSKGIAQDVAGLVHEYFAGGHEGKLEGISESMASQKIS